MHILHEVLSDYYSCITDRYGRSSRISIYILNNMVTVPSSSRCTRYCTQDSVHDHNIITSLEKHGTLCLAVYLLQIIYAYG